MPERTRARMVAYFVAVLATVGSLLIRWPLRPVLGDAVPHMTFFPAVMMAAYFGGFGPGLLATTLSAVAANYLIPHPLPSFQATRVNETAALILFVLVGTIISGLSESLHRARRRIVDHERQRAEEARRETEERFRQLAENIHEIFWMRDARQERMLYVSPGYEEVWGRTRQSLYEQPRSWIDSVHPDDRDRTIEHMEQLGRGVFTDSEFRVVRPDGSIRWIRNRAFPVTDGHGDVTRIAGLVEDITKGKFAEAAVRASEQRFRTFVDHAADAFFLHETGTARILDVNRRACESLGYTRDELIGMTPFDFDPDHSPARRDELARQLEAGKTATFESRHRGKDGTVFPVEIRAQEFWEDGRRSLVSLARDITDRKRADEALRESERRWRGLTEALPQLVWSAAPDGSCDYFSSQWTEHTGVSECDLLGWLWLDVLHPDDREPTRRHWLDSVAGRGPYDVEYRVRRRDGVYRWFKTRGSPIRDDAGNIFKWFGSCTDITDLRQTEGALRAAKEAAEAANRAKDEFLANVSHEIRTPMNAILGMTELALDTPLTDDQRQSLRTVKSAADNLLGIINDLLDFSKIEAGKLELDPADFSLRAALGDTLRALAVRAHRKGLEMVCHVEPEVPDGLVGDAGRLRQVLLNLVGNAIKFTNDGEVVVRVGLQIEKDEEERAAISCSGNLPSAICNLQFSVSDTGIGISQDRQEKIFRAFEQEDTSTTRKYGGTGLGLTIAARLVNLMGGQITVESEPGRGSTFAFTARFARQPLRPEPADARPPALLRDLRVLVVDDNATNRRILEEWLRAWQMEPAAVGDGLAALDALWDAVSLGRPYGLVLLDARMPDTDGLTLAAKIRKRAELSATRIVLLTSGDRPGDLGRARELRVNGHLLKPVQQEELLEAIYGVMSGSNGDEAAPGRPVPAEPQSPAVAPLRILVAEDNEFNTRHLAQLLALRGQTVRLASNGREALALLGIDEHGSGDGPLPGPLTIAYDLMLLDLHMPELDGFQVIRAIREREGTVGGHLPVIALTARSRKEDRERCLAAGMDDYLAKPLRAVDLFAAIDRAVSALSVTGPAEPEAADGARLLDPAVLLAACGDDAEALRARCQDLRAYLPGRLAEVSDALWASDAPRLREAAHKLCGLLSIFSTAAAAVAMNLEDRAAAGQLNESPHLVQQLETMARELVRQLDGLSIEILQSQPLR